MIFPVYEFRPHPTAFRGSFRRYADGLWLPDDGEYDTCFIGDWDNISLYISLPYQKNIICSWLTVHWTGSVQEHPRANPWHYALRDGETQWGGDWGQRGHPNSLAGDAGMNKVAGERGCANGRHVEFKANDKHIAAGLVRDRETKEVFRFPDNLRCMYCDRPAPILCEDASSVPSNDGNPLVSTGEK